MDHQRVALVTGGGTGIGKAAAKALLQAGYQVVITGRNIDKLEAALKDIGGTQVSTLAVASDVGDPESVKQLFARLKEKFGRLDVLFNNAGTASPPVPMEELSYAQWMNVVNANLTGSFLCAQAAMRMMKSQSPKGGRIINNGSISANTPRPFSAPYTATKHAITGLTKAASLDGRPFDIAVGQIDIGNVASDMTSAMAAGVPQADGSIRPEARMEMSAVVETFMTMARLPLSANILFTTVMATKMPYVGRG